MRHSLKRVMGRKGTRNATESVAEQSPSFADMYDTHVDEVYRFVHRRCRDHSLSEDVTQDTFMTAIGSTDDPGSISVGWLLTVARNRLLDVLRRQTTFDGKLRLVAARGTDRHDVDVAERLRVEGALNQLSVDHRLVLTLHYVDGLTVPALAEQLDRSPKSIEGLVTRARRELRAILEKNGDETEARVDHG